MFNLICSIIWLSAITFFGYVGVLTEIKAYPTYAYLCVPVFVISMSMVITTIIFHSVELKYWKQIATMYRAAYDRLR